MTDGQLDKLLVELERLRNAVHINSAAQIYANHPDEGIPDAVKQFGELFQGVLKHFNELDG